MQAPCSIECDLMQKKHTRYAIFAYQNREEYVHKELRAAKRKSKK